MAPPYRTYYPTIGLENYIDPDTGESKQGYSISQIQADFQALEPVAQMPALSGNAGKYPKVASNELGFEFADPITSYGLILGQETSVSTTPYDVTYGDRYFAEVSNSFDRRLNTLRLTAGDTTAQTVNLNNDAKVNDQVVIVIPDSKTAAVTVGLQTGASFNDGSTTWTAMAPKGSGVERVLVFTCRQNIDGTSAVWEASGDLVPKNGYYSLAYPLVAALGRTGTLSFSTNTTLSTSDEGKLLDFTGTSAATLTLPSTWTGTRGVWPIFNTGTAALTISGGTSGSITVSAGDSATIVRGDSSWYVLPAGTFTVMS